MRLAGQRIGWSRLSVCVNSTIGSAPETVGFVLFSCSPTAAGFRPSRRRARRPCKRSHPNMWAPICRRPGVPDMCGICGAVACSDLSAGEAERFEQVEAMLQSLAHRGPDSVGHAVSAGGVLGATRLAIRGLSDAAQPIVDE